jgi:anti-anti-sigma factor
MSDFKFMIVILCVQPVDDEPARVPQRCRIWSTDGLPVITLPDEVDAANVGQLRDTVLEVSAEDPSVVIVDMTETTYIDASTIGVLLPLAKRLHDSGGELRVVLGSAPMPRHLLLEMFQLNQFSRIVTDMEEAVAGPRSPARYVHAA